MPKVTVPRYESSRKFPSARNAGIMQVSDDEIAAVGMNAEQLSALLSRLGPEAKINYDRRSLKDITQLNTKGGGWQSFTGRLLEPDEVERGAHIGVVVAKGKGIGQLTTQIQTTYAQFRNATMAMVLIDWE
ncbi:MAG TPA: hypothetical protein VKB86_15615 [Pyrinomonadaceae bacterium]|nr:hypothetical protein [Pyrinomonadaceae bacterium]